MAPEGSLPYSQEPTTRLHILSHFLFLPSVPATHMTQVKSKLLNVIIYFILLMTGTQVSSVV